MKTEYKNELPLEEKLLQFMTANPRPLEFFEILRALGVDSRALDPVVKKLARENKVYRSVGRRLGLRAGLKIMQGTISSHPKGFGFVNTEDDIEGFVPPPAMNLLISGDNVEFALFTSPRDGKEAAEVIRLVSRPESFWLGQVEQGANGFTFRPDEGLNPVVELQLGSLAVEAGDTIQVSVAAGAAILVQNKVSTVKARAIQNLGKRGRPGFDTDYANAKWLIPTEFQKESLDQAEAYSDLSELEAGRVDLRNMQLVTIDGESTRDFDDAIFAEELEGSTDIRLVVAIADVAHYVSQDSPLDVEAKKRGNSVYFPERVIPMLPERLSNVLCSLNPEADRFAMACDMVISEDGQVKGYKFYSALIRSHARLTYNQVTEALTSGQGVDSDILPMLHVLNKLHEGLRQRRKDAGMLEFQSREPKLVVVNDEIVDIEWHESTLAHHIVEECMLSANRLAAAFLKQHGVSPMYRYHPAPEGEDWVEARNKLRSLGFALSDEASLAEMSSVLNASRDVSNFGVIEENLRKSMKSASYDTERSSHFSLGFDEYAHFTSPIRRYPDLLVHRAIKAILAGVTVDIFDGAALAEHCGETSRRADRATRFVWNLIKRRHLAKFIGSEQEAKFILGNKRGAKVVLLDFDCAAWMTADSLLKKGYVWDDPTKAWAGPDELEAGVRVKATIQAADELDISVALM